MAAGVLFRMAAKRKSEALIIAPLPREKEDQADLAAAVEAMKERGGITLAELRTKYGV